MKRILSPGIAKIDPLTIVAPIEQGGVASILNADAAFALGGIDSDTLGDAGSIVELDANGKVAFSALPVSSVASIAVKGPREVAPGSTTQYSINNFDSKTNYIVSVTAGSVSILNSVITFTAPSAVQSVTLAINGRSIIIPVVQARPKAPTVTAVGFQSTTGFGIIATSSTYETVTGAATHAATDWDVATDIDFNSIVFTIASDTSNLTANVISNLNASTVYFIRTRYRDNAGGVGSWSQVFSIKVKDGYTLDTQLAKLTANDGAASDFFGSSVAVSSDGSRIAIGAYGVDSNGVNNVGAIYIYRNTGLGWTQEAKLLSGETTTNVFTGYSLSITADGSRIAVGGYGANAAAGAVFIFVRSGTTWALETKLGPSVGLAGGDAFGLSSKISVDGTRLVVGAYAKTDNGVTAAGVVYVFVRANSTWTLEATLKSNSPMASEYFGQTVTMSGDSTRIAVAATNRTISSISAAGAVYVFKRTGTAWTYEATITAVTAATESYGVSLAMDHAANVLLIGAARRIFNGNPETGAVDVHVRDNTSWSLQTTLKAPSGATGDQFGSSVTVSADGSLTAVAAVYTNTQSITQHGSYYVFKRVNTSWSFDRTVNASDKSQASRFGSSLAMSTDGVFLAVGSSSDSTPGAQYAGSAYVFKR